MLKLLSLAGILIWYLLSHRRRVTDEATFGKIVMPGKEVPCHGAVLTCRASYYETKHGYARPCPYGAYATRMLRCMLTPSCALMLRLVGAF